jgi:hypothetical protein
MEEINQLPFRQFFSFKDNDGFIYGFDLISLYNLILNCTKGKEPLKNPYNRQKISDDIVKQFHFILRISKMLKIPLELDISNYNTYEISNKKAIELRALSLFQTIDSLGNYSDPQWFLSLNRIQLIKFIRELSDIWNYRAQLSEEVKRSICPPHGDPFRHLNIFPMQNDQNIEQIRKNILEVLEKIVNTGIDKDSRCLGAYYVLGSITLVNEVAANAIPWLYQSVCYF